MKNLLKNGQEGKQINVYYFSLSYMFKIAHDWIFLLLKTAIIYSAQAQI